MVLKESTGYLKGEKAPGYLKGEGVLGYLKGERAPGYLKDEKAPDYLKGERAVHLEYTGSGVEDNVTLGLAATHLTLAKHTASAHCCDSSHSNQAHSITPLWSLVIQ